MAKKNAKVPRSAAARSSAAIFANVDSPAEIDNSVAEVKNEAPEQDVEPEDVKFPLSLIYEFQDFLNANLTLNKGVEIMAVLYLCQIFYLHLSAMGATDVLYAVGFNVAGAVLAMYMSHRAQVKRHRASPGSEYPRLPHFNILYSFFIPYSFFLLYSDYTSPFFQVNLSLTNFAIGSLHPAAKALSAFVYYYMFNEGDTVELVQFAQVLWIYYAVDYALTQWNTKTATDEQGNVSTLCSLDPTEIHLIAMLLINLLSNFRVSLTENSIPLVIAHILAVALFGALGASYPFYYLYSSVEGSLRALLSVLVVSSFGGVFYFLTDYLFQMKVEKTNAVVWLYEYISKSEKRTQLLLTWALSLAILVPVVFFASYKNLLSLNLRRKIWHILIAGSLAYPALLKEPTFTALAVIGSVFVFVIVEFLRGPRLTFIGGILNDQLKRFQDHKDLSGPLNLSYIFLLVGVSLPIAIGVLLDDVVSLRSYIGLITLGLGDTFASIIGRAYGKRKWAHGTRTLEGTVAFIVSTYAGLMFVDNFLLPESKKVHNWENLLITALIGGAVEGASTMNDNILIPSISVITLEIVCLVFK